MTITQTTLSIAIPGTITSLTPVAQSAPSIGYPSGTIVTPVSMTGIVAPGPNKVNRIVLWIDREAFEVLGITANGLSAICNRGHLGSLKVPHVAGVPVYVGRESDFSYWQQNENGNGFGLYSRMSADFFTTNPTTLTDTATLTAAALLGGMIVGTPTAAANYTLPTAALIIAAMASLGASFIGQSFEFVISNTSAGANTITAVAGTGVTLAGGTSTVVQNATRRYRVVITSVALNTVNVYSAS